MKKNVLKMFCLGSLFWACGAQQKALDESSTKGDLDANLSREIRPQIGQSWSAYSNDFLKELTTCLDLNGLQPSDYIYTPPQFTEVNFAYSMNGDEVKKVIGANAHAKLDMSGVEIEGDMEIANDFQSNEFSASLVVSVNAEGGSYAINSQKFGVIKANALAKSLAGSNNQIIAEKCGTHALTGYTLGGYYMAKLEFNFANQSDKSRFEGRLKAAISAFEVDGSVKIDFSEFSQSASVKLRIIQKGGNSILSASGLSEQVIYCTPNNMTACLDAFKSTIAYAKTLNTQFDGPEDYVPMNGTYTEIETLLPDIKPKKPSATMLKALELQKESLIDHIENTLEDRTRAKVLMDAPSTSVSQKRALASMVTFFNDNILNAAKAYDACSAIADDERKCIAAVKCFTGDQCADAVSTYGLQIDSDASLKVKHKPDYSNLVLVSTKFSHYCTNIEIWHRLKYGVEAFGHIAAIAPDPTAAAQQMSLDEVNAITAILNLSSVRSNLGNYVFNPRNQYGVQSQYYTPGGLLSAGNYLQIDRNVNGVNVKERLWDCGNIENIVEQSTNSRVNEVNLSDKGLQLLDPITTLRLIENLNISDNYLFESPFVNFSQKNFVGLRTLKASNARISDLTGLNTATLRELDLSGNYLTSEELAKLVQTPNLVTLNLSNNSNIYVMDYFPRNFPRLRTLNLQNLEYLDNASMAKFVTQAYYGTLRTPPVGVDVRVLHPEIAFQLNKCSDVARAMSVPEAQQWFLTHCRSLN